MPTLLIAHYLSTTAAGGHSGIDTQPALMALLTTTSASNFPTTTPSATNTLHGPTPSLYPTQPFSSKDHLTSSIQPKPPTFPVLRLTANLSLRTDGNYFATSAPHEASSFPHSPSPIPARPQAEQRNATAATQPDPFHDQNGSCLHQHSTSFIWVTLTLPLSLPCQCTKIS